MDPRLSPGRRSALIALAAAGLLVSGPAVLTAEPQPRTESETVTVFAAASLKTVLDAAAQLFAADGEAKPVVSLAASSALAKQIEQGAPADVFISADEDWMDYLDGKNLIVRETRTSVASNRLVLIAPAASTVEMELKSGVDLAAALGGGRLAVADVKAVPAGKYAKAGLESLGAWGGVEGRLAQAENVRAALALVARGEAPLGIVYRSDALADTSVRIVATFPDASHPPIVYPAAVTRAARSPEASRRLIALLGSPQGRELFARHGFGPPDGRSER